MPTINSFIELECWQLSRALAKAIFTAYTDSPTFNRDYALRDQIRKSSGSVMDNIAEGFERGNNKEFNTFLGYSSGSAAEAKSQLYRAFDSKYIDETSLTKFLAEIRMIENKIHRLQGYLIKTNIRGFRHYSVSEPTEIRYGDYSEFEGITFPWTNEPPK